MDVTEYLDRRTDLDDPRIASLVDEVSFWSSRFGRLLYDNVELRPGIRALDVGCGNGFPLFELAQAHGSSCRFVGIDMWGQAIRRAAEKRTTYGLDYVHIVRGDGARLPFSDSTFDLIVSNVGVNNFEDPVGALRECGRAARPGARIVLTTNVRGHMREFYDAFREVLEKHGRPESLERLDKDQDHRASQEMIAGWLEDAGFRVTRTIEDSFILRYLDGGTLLRHSLTRFGFLDGWRAAVDTEDERAIFAALERKLDAIAEEESELRMTVPMLYIEGAQ